MCFFSLLKLLVRTKNKGKANSFFTSE
jgi:hypothetical protein